jgi:dTDP-4-dehydrorhamnose 3,5-epimerase
MEFEATDIPDVLLIHPKVYQDDRGYFLETWQERKFASGGLSEKFVQDNHSRSARHTLRGLHYQIKQPQGKLVRVASGAVFDVAVDLRRSSPTFGHFVGLVLSEENHCMLWVPPGFAHGFLTLSRHADFIYRCTEFWAPEHERTIIWDDPDLGVAWPMASGIKPVLSAKDSRGKRLRDSEWYA